MIRASLISICLTALLSSLTACPGGDSLSPREACEGASVAICERLYSCLSAADIAASGLPASESACVTAMDTANGCAAETLDNACEGNETFHAAKADQCLDQLSGISCGQIDESFATVAPACNLVCSID